MKKNENIKKEIMLLESQVKKKNKNKKIFQEKIRRTLAYYYSEMASIYLEKNQNIKKGEEFLLKSLFNLHLFQNNNEFKVSVVENIINVYRKQNKIDDSYNLLSVFVKSKSYLKLPENLECEYEFLMNSVENIYISFADVCFLKRKFDESLIHLGNILRILKNFIENEEKIKIFHEQNGESSHEILEKLKLKLAYCYYLEAKNFQQKEEFTISLSLFNKAYEISENCVGKNNWRTLKYKDKYEKIKIQLQDNNLIPNLDSHKLLKNINLNNSNNNNIQIRRRKLRQKENKEKSELQRTKARLNKFLSLQFNFKNNFNNNLGYFVKKKALSIDIFKQYAQKETLKIEKPKKKFSMVDKKDEKFKNFFIIKNKNNVTIGSNLKTTAYISTYRNENSHNQNQTQTQNQSQSQSQSQSHYFIFPNSYKTPRVFILIKLFL